MDNEDRLNDMTQEGAFKSITVADLGASILQPQYFNQFVIEATRNQSIFSEARRVIMEAQVVNIDRTGFAERIMEKAVEDTAPTGTKPTFAQEKLIAEEFIASSGINDRSLRRNIEKNRYASTLISMMTGKYGEDWESLAVFGDKNKYPAGNLLKSQDGWIKKCNKKLYGTGAGKDFDKAGKISVKLNEMLKAYPKNYLKNRRNLRFYLNSDEFSDYLDEVGERPTLVGDNAVGGYIARPFKQVPIIEAPVLNDEIGTNTTNGYGNVSMLMDPNNMVYGIFHNITMEPDRQPKLRKTDYIITTESDQGYENPNVGVVALNDMTKP